MSGKKFRRRLFGFKKSDVFDYIKEMDMRCSEELAEKDEEVRRANAERDDAQRKYRELDEKRDAIAAVLENAYIDAERIKKDAAEDAAKTREEAAQEANDLRLEADREIENKKNEANREIELKRREIRNMYEIETRKISDLKGEVYELRKKSLAAIRVFEEELGKIETHLGYREEGSARSGSEVMRGGVRPFENVRPPIKVIRRKNNAI